MTKIPEFLLEMSKQINTQDNRITADPLWMVCYDKEYPTSEDHSEFYQWLDYENEYHVIYCSKTSETNESDIMQEYMKEYYQEWCNENLFDDDGDEEVFDVDLHASYLPKHIEIVWLNTKQEVVKACLTEADANWFIERKQHDYQKLYTYVFSMCYCPQMIELRNWISSLTDKE